MKIWHSPVHSTIKYGITICWLYIINITKHWVFSGSKVIEINKYKLENFRNYYHCILIGCFHGVAICFIQQKKSPNHIPCEFTQSL